jgi:hypothetical protein
MEHGCLRAKLFYSFGVGAGEGLLATLTAFKPFSIQATIVMGRLLSKYLRSCGFIAVDHEFRFTSSRRSQWAAEMVRILEIEIRRCFVPSGRVDSQRQAHVI